ncbi:MAG: PEP/pyruvate-binding domain-containing protein [Candidatus Zixiibacteriota bacterium]
MPDHDSIAALIPAFDRHFFDGRERMTRIGTGSIGGKAKGMALMRDRIHAHFAESPIPGLAIDIPSLAVLGTDVFDQFIAENNLLDIAHSTRRDDEIAKAFQQAELPAQVVGDLRALIAQVHTPLAVRSSSHLEDAMYQPFASVYTTKMIPNNQFDTDTRFRRLVEAIKYVYASTFFGNAKNYMLATEYTTSDEHMAVVIQEIVGQRHEDRFYPHIAGVARSYNYYPTGNARPEDGVVDLALGLGRTIVDEGLAWTYSPRFPRAKPPYNSPADLLKNSQTRFWAVNMGAPPPYDPIRDTEYLKRSSIGDAERDGVLGMLCSTYNAGDDRIEPGMRGSGPRVLDFAPILDYEEIPLNQALITLLRLCEDTLSVPVEIEFAVTLPSRGITNAQLGFLQVRPMVVSSEAVEVTAIELNGADVIAATENALGNGELDTLTDIVYVDPAHFSALRTRVIAGEIEVLNRALLSAGRPYVLIGFGRWGSSDPSLGIPVNFGQISGAKVIIESTLPEMLVTLSQGSHFFHNITSFRIMYFSVAEGGGRNIDWSWLNKQTVVQATEHARWVRTEKPLVVRVDGRRGWGVIHR